MSTVSSTTPKANDIRSDYMNLLITQLRNQNPLEPLDNNQMAGQLATFSQLEQLENMNSTFQKVLAIQQMNQASGLIGRQVSYLPTDSQTPQQGRVDGVKVVDGDVKVTVGTQVINLDAIQSVQN
jgi:flagellar basal-body rod modification protein FlgD